MFNKADYIAMIKQATGLIAAQQQRYAALVLA